MFLLCRARFGHAAVDVALERFGQPTDHRGLNLGFGRTRADLRAACHERLEALTRHIGRVVFLIASDLRVIHFGTEKEVLASVGYGINAVTVTAVSFSSYPSASANAWTKAFDAP